MARRHNLHNRHSALDAGAMHRPHDEYEWYVNITYTIVIPHLMRELLTGHTESMKTHTIVILHLMWELLTGHVVSKNGTAT
ncbi:hypothetical protein [Pseudoalteromonas ardens]|uniref:hypothetical protein n=1 Tax=Pseudoalteromonas ardens TaxID=3048490 RepID=UPI0024C3BDE2|nr:hypothetical protein [Pseudoalteromonas sp. R96]MDK1312351.1 hypothetical protein [Pseudoalteromonas sp. R96]